MEERRECFHLSPSCSHCLALSFSLARARLLHFSSLYLADSNLETISLSLGNISLNGSALSPIELLLSIAPRVLVRVVLASHALALLCGESSLYVQEKSAVYAIVTCFSNVRHFFPNLRVHYETTVAGFLTHRSPSPNSPAHATRSIQKDPQTFFLSRCNNGNYTRERDKDTGHLFFGLINYGADTSPAL